MKGTPKEDHEHLHRQIHGIAASALDSVWAKLSSGCCWWGSGQSWGSVLGTGEHPQGGGKALPSDTQEGTAAHASLVWCLGYPKGDPGGLCCIFQVPWSTITCIRQPNAPVQCPFPPVQNQQSPAGVCRETLGWLVPEPAQAPLQGETEILKS